MEELVQVNIDSDFVMGRSSLNPFKTTDRVVFEGRQATVIRVCACSVFFVCDGDRLVDFRREHFENLTAA